MQPKEKLTLGILLSVFIAVIALRAYGYYTNDQSAFLFYAKLLADKGALSTDVAIGLNRNGNFHPPLLILLLSLFYKISTLYIAPALLMAATTATAFYFLQKTRILQSENNSFRQHLSFMLLFFCLPMTHQNALFLDIDNTVLFAWTSLFIYMQQKADDTWRYHLLLGVLFAAGLWCKLTTPPVIMGIWFVLQISRRCSVTRLARKFTTMITALAVFFCSYMVLCILFNLPPEQPFTITFGKFINNGSQTFHITTMTGTAIRCMYYYVHWFTPPLFILAGYATFRAIQKTSRSGNFLQHLQPHLYFWILLFGYTFIVPSGFLPRYFFGFSPFLVMLLADEFEQFIGTISGTSLRCMGVLTIILFFVLPDFPTSAYHEHFRYHWFSLLKIPFDYYPPWFVALLHRGSEWASGHALLAPFRLFFFISHYLSLAFPVMLLLYTIMVTVPLRFGKTFLNALYTITIPVWIAMFVQDMSREYQLFYDAGYNGFEQTVTFLREHLRPGERFLGYRDLALYTEHESQALYYYKNYRTLDTTFIDSLAGDDIRYIAFLKDQFYSNEDFTRYLDAHCKQVFSHCDYRVYAYRSDR